MKRLISNLKLAIIKWLGFDVQIDKLTKENESIKHKLTYLQGQLESRISVKESEMIRLQNKMLMDVTKVAVDVNPTGRGYRNWAIVVLDGKEQYMEFFELPREDIHQIQDFLRMFKRSNISVDCPSHMRKFFF